MFKTLLTDRKIIEEKYHKNDGTFDHLNRWGVKGYDFDEATGMADEDIIKGIASLDAKFEAEGLPHPIHKAKLFEYVLDNTRIDVAPHDYFVGIYSNGRLLAPTRNRWSDEVYSRHKKETEILFEKHEKSGSFFWLA